MMPEEFTRADLVQNREIQEENKSLVGLEKRVSELEAQASKHEDKINALNPLFALLEHLPKIHRFFGGN